MREGGFDLQFAILPKKIAIFPLAGVLLLPRGRLPLNIFEPRYLAMTMDALGNRRILGMVQPRWRIGTDERESMGSAQVYQHGCAGRIVSFNETEDGRLLITLLGLCRFRIMRELTLAEGGYRQVEVDYHSFSADMEETPVASPLVDRKRLLACLRHYCTQHHITLNWKVLDSLPDPALITAVAMLCPFGNREKQALLEVYTVEERGQLLISLIEMSLLEEGRGGIA